MRGSRLAAVLAASVLLLAGCGSADDGEPSSSPTPEVDLAANPWLIRFNAEAGGDGEITRAVYLTYTPSTGATQVQRLPAVNAPATSSDGQAVLVSGDRTTALLDTEVPRADGRRGRVATYPTLPGGRSYVDVRALTGEASLVPVAAAFAPDGDRVLRVVDTQRRVWKLDLDAGTGARDGDLPRHADWIFAAGFDKNSGLPFIEATDTDETLPAGNGYRQDDDRPGCRGREGHRLFARKPRELRGLPVNGREPARGAISARLASSSRPGLPIFNSQERDETCSSTRGWT